MRAFVLRRVASLGLPGFAIASLAIFSQFCSTAMGQDFKREMLPNKWIERYEPEKLPDLEYPPYFNDLDKAKAQAFAGRYKLSLLTLYKVKSPKPEQLPDIALVRGKALGQIGKKTEALAALSNPKVADDLRVQIARANLLIQLGRQSEAIELLKGVVAKHPDSIAAHYYLGAALEGIGQIPAAVDVFSWFEPLIDKWQGQGSQAFTDAEEVTLMGRGLDRWATLTSQYRTRSALNNIIFGMFLKAYDEIDRAYWPAHVAAAEYAISHDDTGGAMKELKLAMKGNPQDVPMMALLGQILVSQFNFDGCEAMVASIQKVDDDAIEAELLSCRDLLQQRRAKEAALPAQRVLARQPRNIEAMGLLAASEALQLHDAKTADLLKQVDRINPADATAYLEVAEQLGAMRQYPRSAAMYQLAIDRAPWWTAAYNGQGLLYTQSGDEDKAAEVLEKARVLDPYNKATTNYMRLLDDLAKFAKKETPHFIVYYNAEKDPVIPEYFAEYLESIYRDVTGEYRHEPKVKTYIEVFPTHDAFSVRTTGSPWIGTVGASTGRVIAMVAPRKGQNTMGSFNWAQVLRHEFTHTVTLSATDNRIAHWMTEGLAVVEEHSPLRWEWVPMLYHAVNKHELFTMDNLTWGFVRPKRPIDRQLAYAESYWICQYIENTYGHEKILLMLEQFREGKEQNEVFPMILGTPMSKFQADFFTWCDKQVAGWGYDDATSKKYEGLVKTGQAQIQARQFKEAAKTWEQIVKLRPVDALPHTRLAGLYLRPEVNQPLKAIEQLVILDKVSLYDNVYAKKISRLYRDNGDLESAMKYGLQAVYIDPYDMTAHELLSQLYEKAGNAAGSEREKRVIPVLADWLEKNRKSSLTKPE